MPPRIPDPKMNPEGERSHGIVFNDKDNHLYIYLKEDLNKQDKEEEPVKESRFFTAGTHVTFEEKVPGFLLKILKPSKDDQDYQQSKYKNGFINPETNEAIFNHYISLANRLNKLIQGSDLKDELKIVYTDWNIIYPKDPDKKPGAPVVIDFIESVKLEEEPEETVNRALNKAAKGLLKSNN